MSHARLAKVLSKALLVMTLGAAVVRGQEEPAKLLTLEEAVSLARSHNRELNQAGLEIHKQQEAFSEARTQLYPRFDTYFLASELLTPLDFTIKSGTFGSFPATGPIPAKDSKVHTPARPIAITSITATQPLTQLLRINLSIKQQKLGVELSQQSFFIHEQDLVNEVRRGYYAILQSQSEIESQRSLLTYLEELQRLTGRRLQQQAVLKADSLRIAAQCSKASYQLTVIQDALADQKEALNRLLGRDLQTEFAVETLPSSLAEESSLQQARAFAIEKRAEIKAETIKKEKATLDTKIEKTRYIPDISIQANYLTAPNISFLPQNLGAVGVLLTWQPWDWGQKRHNIAQKVDAEKQAQLSIDSVREQVLQEVDSTFRKLREARELLLATQAARDAEAEKLRNDMDAYSHQTIHQGQLLTLQLQNGAARYSGRVTSISPSADARNRVFSIEVTLSNRQNTLKPGMIASVELGGKRETPQPSVPLSAIVPYPGESAQFAVMVAERQSGQWKAHVRRVTVGATHGSSASVTGVHSGEKVVAIGAQLVKEGDSLSVIP